MAVKYTVGTMSSEVPPRRKLGRTSEYVGLYGELKSKVSGLSNGSGWPTYFDRADDAMKVCSALRNIARVKGDKITFEVRGAAVYARRGY